MASCFCVLTARRSSASHTGWEQSEEVARRLLQDMAVAEARERAKHARDREYGSLVAEAHKHGVSVERPWEQEEVRAAGCGVQGQQHGRHPNC